MRPTSKHFANEGSLAFLDGLRGLAAFYVMVGHSRGLLWEGYSLGFLKHPSTYTIAEKAMVYLLSCFILGHQAVFFFFVLSGFVIHLRYAKRMVSEGKNATFDWANFIRRRAKRLFPPLILAMVLTFALDSLGSGLGYGIYFHRTPYPLLNSIVKDHTLTTCVGNLLFLMDTYVPAWGSDGPLWSLKFEWWFYMLYPIFWFLSKRSIVMPTIVLIVLFVLSFYPALWAVRLFPHVFSAMLAWWFGVLLADVYCHRIDVTYRHLSILSILLCVLPFIKGSPVILDMLWALSFAGLISLFFFVQQKGLSLRPLEVFKPLGDMSYTLYVTHHPVLILMSGWLMSRNEAQLLPKSLWYVLCGILVSLALAYPLHLIVERPFARRASTRPSLALKSG